MKKKIISKNFEIPNQEMYCQGCGSKVSKSNTIGNLSESSNNNELAEIVKFSNNQKNFDHIKLFNSIDFDFGIISYLDSQNDIILLKVFTL